MNTIQERFQFLLESKGLTPYQLSKKTGISDATLGRILNKGSKPNSKTMESLCKYFDITEEWFLTGKESTVTPKLNEIPVNDSFEHEFSANKNSNQFTKLPNGQWFMTMPLAEHSIQAGFLDHYQDLDFLTDIVQHSIIVDKPVQGRYVAFRVKGDSMDDGTKNAIEHNNIVSCRELQRQHWIDKLRTKDFPYWVIYTTQSKMPLLKQIVAHDTIEAKIKCHSLNDGPDYSDFELSLNDVQALFYVIDVNRSVSNKLNY